MKRISLRSFERSYNKLSENEKDRVDTAIQKLLNALTLRRTFIGLGLKKLRSEFWEARADLSYRILFYLEKDRIVFAFVGDHDDVRRYLKKS